ncbi:hypothetical protein CASFOL_025727 [Castilleja foliolosa]|uniref:RNase H type-1 domain-containing protein n=1 Tax=Castilleja foliolosa TaxID=1961234 RepID=A0ABD3CRX1_9LAMI
MKIKDVIVESDCLLAILMLTTKSQNCFWTVSPILDKIFKIWHCWPNWRFKYVPRLANRAPHALAHWAAFCNFEGVLPLNIVPVSVFCDVGYPLLVSTRV